jgi:hypothetical protein
MTIDTTPVNMPLDSPIMQDLFGVIITLELRTMIDEPYTVHANLCFSENNPLTEKPATLQDLIKLIIRRQHPRIDYIAEQNGVKLIQYKERPSFKQSMSAISYDPITKTLHV